MSHKLTQGARYYSQDLASHLLSVGGSLRTVGASLVQSLHCLTADYSDKEPVDFVKFGHLAYAKGASGSAGGQQCRRQVVLLGYRNGFQVWDVQDTRHIHQLVSRRDGPVRALEPVPLPQQPEQSGSLFWDARPLLALVPSDTASLEYDLGRGPSATGDSGQGPGRGAQEHGLVQIYSLRTHSYAHTLSFEGRVLSVKCSCRLMVVALQAQLLAYDAVTMTHLFSAITYQPPASRQPAADPLSAVGGSVPIALGPRWVAYASNQAVANAGSCPVGQAVAPSRVRRAGAGSGSGGAAGFSSGYEAVQHFAGEAARRSGSQLRVLGEASYKYLSAQFEIWRSGASGTDGLATPRGAGGAAAMEDDDAAADAAVAGTVLVRDVVSRTVVAHFRAHTSPLALLEFDPSSTLLVSASVHGHNINIFKVCPPAESASGASSGPPRPGMAVHMFRLSRGLTPAVIQSIHLSPSGEWLCASSARGTTHLFHLAGAPPLQDATPAHLAIPEVAGGSGLAMPPLPAEPALHDGVWAGRRPLRLGAVGRARHGGGILNANVPGSAAAAAAVNMYSGWQAGAAGASAFMLRGEERPPRGGRRGLPDGDTLEEELFVMSSDGFLIRHALRLPPNQAGLGEDGLKAPSPPYTPRYSKSAPSGHEVADDLGGSELSVEAVEKWDLIRRRTSPEHEEMFAEPRDTTPASRWELEERQLWLAAMETRVHGKPPLPPVWADPQFHILEMQPSKRAGAGAGPGPHHKAAASDRSGAMDSADNVRAGWTPEPPATPPRSPDPLLAVEEVPTRRINSARGQLAPVITEGAETAVLRCTPMLAGGGMAWAGGPGGGGGGMPPGAGMMQEFMLYGGPPAGASPEILQELWAPTSPAPQTAHKDQHSSSGARDSMSPGEPSPAVLPAC